MKLSYEQKRAYRRQLVHARRALSRSIASYLTPELFNVPSDSRIARDRAVGFFPTIQRVWPNLDVFLDTHHVRKGVHSVWHQGLPIDFQLTRTRADVLLVVFHGALELNAALPLFPGANVTRGLRASRLAFTDPSLYLSPELPLAWYAGSVFQPDLASQITKIIRKVARSTRAKRIVLFGSSGGGFASLVQAAAIPQATALIANAQTNVLLYHEYHVQKYLDIAWGGDRKKFVAAGQSSAIERLNASMPRPRVLYMQNSTDAFHIRRHLNPFMQRLGSELNVQLLLGNWGDGHVAPPKELFRASLEAVVENDDLALERIGFVPGVNYSPE
ncbi:hypothetical protein [Corynebacterium sp. NML180780]|uniref:hypothetical protein n=1 Tax=Corynebacterium sp. NML180780 TaxID=2598459 RepID=UPI00119786AC|nr:hypothetical protein [Corynebacterium sp. NML180780]TVX76176.1 hypothetical protein FPP74_11415 [Corynebacterium sp. NML180780]